MPVDMLNPPSIATSFGRIISVRGSYARLGIHAAPQMGISEARATVGRFVSVRCNQSNVIAMITEVSCEGLAAADRDRYVATAAVDLLREINPSPNGRRFQRGVQ